MNPPVIYQVENGNKNSISGYYILREENKVGFHVLKYDQQKPLVIDPIIEYSTYLGGSLGDWSYGIAVDEAGNAYVTGEVWSSDFPILNPLQNSLEGLLSAFITKFDPLGAVVFSTYIGGNSIDSGGGIVIDSFGNIWVTGWTNSTNFPTLNSIQSDQPGRDVFVTKLEASGSISFSTYLGGNNSDSGTGIAVDEMGNIYVTGNTSSTDFLTFNAFQGNQPLQDSFVTKLNASGAIVFSTYLGGNGNDWGVGIAADSFGNAYATGGTLSTDFPKLNSIQDDQPHQDAFVTKLDHSGNLVYSTYLGGNSDDRGNGIVIDKSDNVYVTGGTFSTDFPSTNNLEGIPFHRDVFVTKLDVSGAIAYSTFFGGLNSNDRGYGIAVDNSGNAYVTGEAWSTNFPLIDAIQGDQQGKDSILVKLDALGRMIFSTYFGGSSGEDGQGIAVDNSGNAYMVGRTFSTDFPTTEDAYDTTYNGEVDVFITKFVESPIPHANDFNGDTQSDILAVHSSGLLVSALIENSVLQEFALLLQADPALGWTVNATGDFNGDKKADLLLYNTTSGDYRMVLLDGVIVLSDTVLFTIDPSIGVEPRGVGDFDGDGEAEIIIYHPPSGFTALVYLTAGVFSSFEAITTIDVAGNWTLKDTGHFNGDNKTDLLITNSVTGEGAIIEMDGSNATGPTTIFFLDPVQGWTVINTGDFTGNGSSDILILHSTGALGVLTFDGLTFQTLYVPGGLLPDWQLINVGNYDGINKADFLIYDTVTGDLMTAVQDGTSITSYTPVLNLGPASGWTYHSGKP